MPEITKLDNGLTIVTDEMTSVQSASLGVWIGSGTRSETRDVNGVAHFLEHMAFKGTKTRSALDIAAEIEDVGGSMNAYTSRENTAYYARMLKGDVPLAMDILADILNNSSFEPQELERERGVILQEIGQAMDTPDDIVFDYFQETAYPDQPMGYHILGPAERVRSLTRDDIMGFMQARYQPGNMVLSAAGAIEHDQMVDFGQRYFGDLRNKAVPDIVPGSYKGGDYRETRDSEQVHFLLGFDGISFHDPDYFALAIMSGILGGGMSSRLFQEVREKRGLAYSVYSFASCHQDCGMVGIYAGTAEQDVSELVPVLGEELNRLPDSLLESEIDRGRAQLKSALLMGLESTGTRCETIASQTLIFGQPRSIDHLVASVDAVTADDIARVARRIFSSVPTVTAIGPVNQLDDYDKIVARLAA